MRRIHLMAALFGITAISATAVAAPHFGGGGYHPRPGANSMPYRPAQQTTPSYRPAYHPTPMPGTFHNAAQPFYDRKPNPINSNANSGMTALTKSRLQNVPITSRKSNVGTPSQGPGKFGSTAKIGKHHHSGLGKLAAALAALGANGGSGGGSDSDGGTDGGGSAGGGYESGGGSIDNSAPVGNNAFDPTTGGAAATDQEWGMKVNEVAPKGAAAQAELRAGDIIVMAAGRRTQSFEDLTSVLAAANGPIEIVILNGENNKLEKMQIVPVDGKVGIATDPVVID